MAFFVLSVVVVAAGNRDFDSAIVTTERMLDVHPSAALVFGIKIEPAELRPRRAITGPARQAFVGVVQITILVQIVGEPDVVINPTIAVFDNIDVAVMVDREVIWAGQSAADRETGGGEVDGIAVRKDRDRVSLQIQTINLVGGSGGHIKIFALVSPVPNMSFLAA